MKKHRNTDLTQKRLKEVVDYNPKTGVYVMKISRGCRKNGDIITGGNHHSGYKYFQLDKVSYSLARLAFLYMDGYFPEHEAEHINRNRSDNRWCNLREATRSCNMKNTSIRSGSLSGVTGVNWHRQKLRWITRVTVNGINKEINQTKYLTVAVYARWIGEKRNGYSDCCSVSSAYLYLKERGLA